MKRFYLLLVCLIFVPFLLPGQNVLTNPGFEDGVDSTGIPVGWLGYPQTGASMEVVNDSSTANSGDYWVKCTSTEGGYYLLYQVTFPANEGDVWRLSSFFKDVSPAFPGGYYAALKISAKSVVGSTFQTWEEYQDSLTSEWKQYSNTKTMPEGTAFIQAVIVIHAADSASEASYGVDDVKLELLSAVDEANMLENPGFEDGDQDANGVPDGWIGYAQTGASLELIHDNITAYAGDYWTKCTSTGGGFYLLYQNTFPAKEGDVWELSSFIKDVSPSDPGAVFAALKISAKDSSGATFKAWEVYQDSVASEWKQFSNIQTMPENTAQIQAVIVVHAADGAPEASYGFDNARLELIYENPVESSKPNYLANPGFEEGVDSNNIPLGWIGYAQSGASIEVVNKNSTAYNGDNWVKCTSTEGGFYLLYQNTFPAKEGDVWELSSFIKDVSPEYPGASYAALKISAKSVTGATFLAWEEYQDSVTTYWKKYKNIQTMPEGTAYIQAVVVIHAADEAPEASYGFDDVKLELVSEVTDESNLLSNPGFEAGDSDGDGVPDGWLGYAQTGASMEIISDALTAHSGVNWVKCTSTEGGYYLLYQNTFPAKEGDIWKLSSFFKDVSPLFPGGYFAALKISAKSVTGATFLSWEEYPDSIGADWQEYTNIKTMPEGTAYIQAVVVIHAADGAHEAVYGVDDVKLKLVAETDPSNYLANAGFEEGVDSLGIPLGWLGYAQTGASMEVIEDAASANSGDYWVKCTSTDGGYYLLYQNTFPAKEGDIWKLSSYFKDLSPSDPGGYYAALKISAKSITGATFLSWEEYQEDITSDWAEYSNIQTMPEGTAFIQAVIVIHAADGAPEASYGIDDVKLKLVAEADTSNYLANPGFELGLDSTNVPMGWLGYAQTGASMELLNDAGTANSGDYWVKCTSTEGGYYLLYQNTFPAIEGQVWKLSSFFKDISPADPGGYYAALKISAKSVTGATFLAWEEYQDSLTAEWEEYSNTQTMPEGTAYIQAVIVIHAADGAPEASYGIDDVSLIKVSDPPVGVDEFDTVPMEYALNQNYPNPFNPSTKIEYSIPEAGNVVLKVYNTIGQEVTTLVSKHQKAGNYTVDFNAPGLASGIYIYRLSAGSKVFVKKMIMLK